MSQTQRGMGHRLRRFLNPWGMGHRRPLSWDIQRACDVLNPEGPAILETRNPKPGTRTRNLKPETRNRSGGAGQRGEDGVPEVPQARTHHRGQRPAQLRLCTPRNPPLRAPKLTYLYHKASKSTCHKSVKPEHIPQATPSSTSAL